MWCQHPASIRLYPLAKDPGARENNRTRVLNLVEKEPKRIWLGTPYSLTPPPSHTQHIFGKRMTSGSSWLSRLWTRLVSIRTRVRSLVSFSGLRIQRCRELCCRSQTWLGSCVLLWLWCRPVARAPIQTPSLGTFICLRSGLRNGKKTNNKIK